jgi:UDP-galactopyranose mutase
MKVIKPENLVDTFYRPYTELMWGKPLEDVAPAIINRVPIRQDSEDRYFPSDPFQFMPSNGYTEMACKMLDHENIRVYLNSQSTREDSEYVDHTFYSGSIDEYFSYRDGHLPYRSIVFETSMFLRKNFQPTTTVNYTDGKDCTRSTEWKYFPNCGFHPENYTLVTTEYPCDYLQNNMERYYPVRNHDSLKTLETYEKAAKFERNVTFVGRCGSFAYMDMDMAVNQGMQTAERFLRK